MQIQKYKCKLNMFKYQLNCRFQSKPPTAKYTQSCGIWVGFLKKEVFVESEKKNTNMDGISEGSFC